jgi:hypothetical protein
MGGDGGGFWERPVGAVSFIGRRLGFRGTGAGGADAAQGHAASIPRASAAGRAAMAGVGRGPPAPRDLCSG